MSGLLAGKRVLVLGGGDVATVMTEALAKAGAQCGHAAVWDDARAAPDLDAIVHTGVFVAESAATAMGLDDWRAGHSADLDQRFFAAAGFARRCLAAGRAGSILMLGAKGGGAARATVNGALDNLVKTLSVEWARDGIRTNAVITRQIGPDGVVAPGAVAALGNLAAWLLSDYSPYVNGCVMGVDETGGGA